MAQTPSSALIHVLTDTLPKLQAMPEAQYSARPAPGKWSPKEIIGHLIDSASNNHQRFIRIQFQEALIFPGYKQDKWVVAQRYQSQPWEELLQLWYSYNMHLARVFAHIPEVVLQKPRSQHNLHEIGFKPCTPTDPCTVLYFIWDYIDHLEHHLKQIFPEYAEVSRDKR